MKKKILDESLKVLMENAYGWIKNCDKCKKQEKCFPRGYVFVLKEIEKCKEMPEIVKVFWRLKHANIIEVEHPFKVNLK